MSNPFLRLDPILTCLILAMHQAWPKLLKRIETGKASDSNEDRRLIISARTWFCLYLFEHQYVTSPISQILPLIAMMEGFLMEQEDLPF